MKIRNVVFLALASALSASIFTLVFVGKKVITVSKKLV